MFLVTLCQQLPYRAQRSNSGTRTFSPEWRQQSVLGVSSSRDQTGAGQLVAVSSGVESQPRSCSSPTVAARQLDGKLDFRPNVNARSVRVRDVVAALGLSTRIVALSNTPLPRPRSYFLSFARKTSITIIPLLFSSPLFSDEQRSIRRSFRDKQLRQLLSHSFFATSSIR
jgi:hypothetical protein